MSALRAVPTDGPASIQGEQQETHARLAPADMAYVDQYAGEVSDGVATCRERVRHRYPPMPRSRPFSPETSGSGLLLRQTDLCLDCGCAYQLQRWEPYEVKVGRKWITRVRPAYSTTEYVPNPETGEEYVTRDHGYIRPRDFRDALATRAVHADPDAHAQAEAALKRRKDVLARREQRAAERAAARPETGRED